VKHFITILFSSLLFIFSASNIEAQTLDEIKADTINRLDSNGKKTGTWIEILNKQLIPANKTNAIFFRYVNYAYGNKLIFKKYSYKIRVVLECDGNPPVKGEVVMLHGTYRIYRKRDLVLLEESVYSRGRLLVTKTFYTNGNLCEHFDFTDKYEGRSESFKASSYWRNGELAFQAYVALVGDDLGYIHIIKSIKNK
jgi:hypothetical protein